MSNDQFENSVADGEPLELYRFSYGTGSATTYTYCDGDVPVTHESAVYAPLPIDREAINASGNLDRSELAVEVPQDSPIAQLFMAYPPSDVVGLTILRCHWDGTTITTPEAIWVGRVLAGNPEGYMSVLRCEPFTTSMARVGLRRHYQFMCPHVLYGTACGANRAEHSTASSVVSYDARSITVPGLVSDQHAGGMVSWNPIGLPGERRTILRVDRDVGAGTSRLTVAGRVNELTVGFALELALGCRHNVSDCRDLFNNTPNFGGQPYIPGDNPHGSTRVYH